MCSCWWEIWTQVALAANGITNTIENKHKYIEVRAFLLITGEAIGHAFDQQHSWISMPKKKDYEIPNLPLIQLFKKLYMSYNVTREADQQATGHC